MIVQGRWAKMTKHLGPADTTVRYPREDLGQESSIIGSMTTGSGRRHIRHVARFQVRQGASPRPSFIDMPFEGFIIASSELKGIMIGVEKIKRQLTRRLKYLPPVNIHSYIIPVGDKRYNMRAIV